MLSSHHGNPHSRSSGSLPDTKDIDLDLIGGCYICKPLWGKGFTISAKGKCVHVAEVKALIHHQVIANHEP